MTSVELAWLAGLLEGEGSFLCGPPSQPNRPRIVLDMTDRDVVARAAKLMAVKNAAFTPRRRNPKWKPSYIVSVSGVAAFHLMTKLRPLMGERRQGQIDAALACYIDRSKKISAARVEEIRAAVRAGRTQLAVAAAFGVARETVNKIVRRRRNYTSR
jgi:hypothetical protein